VRPEGKIAVGQAKFEDDIATFDIAEVTEPLSESVEHRRPLAVRHRKDADARDLRLRLLTGRGSGHEKQHGEPDDDDAAAFHSMTSSTRAMIDGGTVKPSAFAAFRLTAS
jgi:hypothetical protein